MAGVLRSTLFLFKGLNEFTRGGYEKAARTFDAAVMQRDLKGKHCMVTGANQGLGYQTSLELAKRGATLYMVCRNAQRGQEAADSVRHATGNADVHLKVCDVSSLQSIRALAADYLADPARPLHLLVNNAGVMVHERQQSADGYELNFATNTLGSFALTLALEPALRRAAAAPAADLAAGPGAGSQAAAVPVSARVVFVSSGGMLTEHLAIDDMQMERARKFDGTVQYARDKRRQVALAEEFARRWQGLGIGVYSYHPGWTETEGVKTSLPGFYRSFQSKLRSLAQGCDTAVWLALQDADKLQPGAFYLDRAPQPKHLALAGTKYGQKDVDALWSALEGRAAPALAAP